MTVGKDVWLRLYIDGGKILHLDNYEEIEWDSVIFQGIRRQANTSGYVAALDSNNEGHQWRLKSENNKYYYLCEIF